MEQTLAYAILTGIFMLSDEIAVRTKSTLSAIFNIGFLIITLNWTVFPLIFGETFIIDFTGISAAIPIVTSWYMVHVGTMISIDDLVKQWKTVLIGFLAVAMIGVVAFFLLSNVIDPYIAIASSPIVAGGAVANIMMQEALTKIEALKNVDLTQAKVVLMMVLCLQSLIALPICSSIMKKEAQGLLNSGQLHKLKDTTSPGSGKSYDLKFKLPLPSMCKTTNGALFRTSLVGYIGYCIATAIGQNSLLICMLMGVLFTSLGFLEKNSLDGAKVSGFTNFMIVMFVFSGYWMCTPELVFGSLRYLVPIFIFGVAAIALNGLITKFIFKESFGLCFAIGLTAMIGSPGTVFLSQEVAAAVADGNEEDRVALEAYILPKMLIAGFATLTIGSVVFATVISPILLKMS